MRKCILAARSLPVAALVLAVAVWVGERAAGQEKKAGAYKSPQDVFTAALSSAATDNWKGLYECLTDDSRELLACQLAITGFLAKELTNPNILTDELKASLKSLNEVFTRNGLTDDHMNKSITIGTGPPKQKSPEEMKKETQEMLKPVKDRGAFIADTFVALRKLNAYKGGLLEGAELKEVKVSGDSATGVMVSKKDGKEQRLAIGFKKITGSWNVELPEKFFFPTTKDPALDAPKK